MDADNNNTQTAAEMARIAAGMPGGNQLNGTQTAADMARTAAGMPGGNQLNGQTAADMAMTAAPMSIAKPGGVQQEVPDGHWTMPLVFAVLAIVIGSSFQFGYHIGCMNMPGGLIKGFLYKDALKIFHQRFVLSYNVSFYNDSDTGPRIEEDNPDFDVFAALIEKVNNRDLNAHFKKVADQINANYGYIVSIFAIGGMFGGVSVGWVADKFGRKMALLCNNSLAVLAAALMTSAKTFYPWTFLLLLSGRLVIGLNSGLNSGMAPMYLMEISPANLRGTIGSFAQLFITIAILVSQFIGMPFLLGDGPLWPFIFAFATVPVFVQLSTLFFCPESPKYNLLIRKRREQAESDLKKLRGEDDVSAELDKMVADDATARAQINVSMLSMFGPQLRWPLFLAMFMMISQQLSGINAAMFYSSNIFQLAGLEGIWPKYATLGVGGINVAMTVASVYLVDHPRFGRRALHIAGMIGMFFTSMLIAGSMLLADIPTLKFFSWFSIIFVLLFVVSFATGPGSIPWFYVSEIFPSNARSNANSYAVLTNWFFTFLVGLLFPIINNIIGRYTFFIFTGFLGCFIVFAWMFLPETKNKTLEEIQAEMGVDGAENGADVSD